MALAVRYDNLLICKQMTTVSPLLLVSPQLVLNIHLSVQNEFAEKCILSIARSQYVLVLM